MTAAIVATEVLGSTTPRLWTPPLVTGPPGPCGCGCALTPETSFGFDVIAFARDVLNHSLDPWQEWVVIHGGELLPDGRPRFRKLLVLVARQNGKTELLVVLSAYWQFVEHVPMILGTSTKLDYAKESWSKVVKLVEKTRALDQLRAPKRWKREANGEQESWTTKDARYKIAASNDEGGRSLTLHRLILDELRQHHDYSAWDASVPAGNAVRHFQVWALSNAGSDRSIVLNGMRKAALSFIKTGKGDPRLGLIEYSAPRSSSPLDLAALAQANPNLGRRIEPEALLGEAATAMEEGGEKLSGFKTENMCIHVKQINPAIDPERWKECLDVGDLSELRDRVALCVDVSIDGLHATLTAAAVLDDGRVRVEPVQAWSGRGCAQEMSRDLPGLVKTIKPRVLGWFPNGPAAAAAADLADRGKSGSGSWPPAGVTVEEIRQEVTAVCMGLANLVESVQVAQSDDPMQNAHVAAAEKLMQGDAWRFTRKGAGHVDGAYAAAGAAHLARTLGRPQRSGIRVLG